MKEKHALVYAVRDELLSGFGYRTYKQYLKSDEWAGIRSGVFARYQECICCSSQPQVVHHVKYDSATLLGLHPYHLAPLCHRCHELMELDANGDKGSLARANTMMFEMARKKDAKQPWLLAFYAGRKDWKHKRHADCRERGEAFRKRREANEEAVVRRDYSGVFWIRARRRR